MAGLLASIGIPIALKALGITSGHPAINRSAIKHGVFPRAPRKAATAGRKKAKKKKTAVSHVTAGRKMSAAQKKAFATKMKKARAAAKHRRR
jgi:hypothetical protein